MSSSSSESVVSKNGRLEQLKARAQAVLAIQDDKPGSFAVDSIEMARLLEDLRIYQVELELQNEELHQAQMNAEAARRQYQALFDQLPLPALVLDEHAMVDASNTAGDVLLGTKLRAGQPAQRFGNLLGSDDRIRLHEALRDVQSGETRCLKRISLDAGNGQVTIFDAHLIGLSIDYKLDPRALLLLVDCTAEIAREEDQRLYGALIDSSDSLIYATDMQGKFLLANHALLDLLRRDREDVVGHKCTDFLPLRDAIVQKKTDQQVLQTGQTLAFEEQIYALKEAVSLDFLTRKFALRDSAGAIYGVGGISTEITAIKEQQRQALLSEAVFMSSDEAIIITDAETRILRVNPAFTRQSGFSADAVLGQRASVLKTSRHSQSFFTNLWQTLKETGRWSGDLNNRRADGGYYTVRTSINAVVDEQNRVLYYIGVQTDVTQLYEARQQLQHQASHDALTGLPNRTLFHDRLSQLIAASKRYNKTFAVLFVDLDHFKEVNDTLGHPTGDMLLCTIAQRLVGALRAQDTVARVGGDEFVVLLPDTDRTSAERVADTLLKQIREPVALDAIKVYHPMASVGVALYPNDGEQSDLLLRNADMAMYGAKSAGRNRRTFYTTQMAQSTDRIFAIQTDLAEAIVNAQLRVFYQPKCRLQDGSLCGAEALVRWERPGHGLVLPGEFISVAEKSGLLETLDFWVLDETLRQVSVWFHDKLWQSGWRVAVNRNVCDLQRSDALVQVQSLLTKHDLPASLLEFEITEDALLNRDINHIDILPELRQMGITLAIDDFGTGYSSLSYLSQLPISVIKIDQSFVRNMLTNDNDAVLVHAIVELAHNLGHTLVAEGVEEIGQLQHLRELACEIGQGYWFGKPVSAHDFQARWLMA